MITNLRNFSLPTCSTTFLAQNLTALGLFLLPVQQSETLPDFIQIQQSMQTVSRVYYYYYNYNRFTALWILSRTTWVSRYQKDETKTNLDFLEQETRVAVASAGPYANLHLALDR